MPVWLEPSDVPDARLLHYVDENGLVAAGGRLDPDTILVPYASGMFPWSSEPVVTWWSPDPRAVFDLETYRPHRSVARSARKAAWRFTIDRDFAGVMAGCAEPGPGREETWISEDFVACYTALHRRGHAHSFEAWDGERLVGGMYGVTIGAFFGGESMFHRATDASKAVVAFAVEALRKGGFTLFDAQVTNPHLERIGAIEIPRDEYLRRLGEAIRVRRAKLLPSPPDS